LPSTSAATTCLCFSFVSLFIMLIYLTAQAMSSILIIL
jgi:hypothetical protein